MFHNIQYIKNILGFKLLVSVSPSGMVGTPHFQGEGGSVQKPFPARVDGEPKKIIP